MAFLMKWNKYILLILTFVIMAGCSVMLKNKKIRTESNSLIFTDCDTLVFQVSSKKHLIDSIACNDSIQTVDNSTFKYALNHLQGGFHSLKFDFHLSNGKSKLIKQDVVILANTPPEIIEFVDYKQINYNQSMFTQGLELHNGVLYQSGGKYGESTINKINVQTGEIEKQVNLDSKFFAEGLTFVNDTIYLLTWKERTLLKYDQDLNLIDQMPYQLEGWGFCFNGTHLIASDGSSTIYFIDPISLQIVKQLNVYNHKQTVKMINELEWVNGFLIANIWGKDYAVVIDPDTGKVLFHIDFSGIINKYDLWGKGVLNGIAYNHKNKKLYFTGKNWPYYFACDLPQELQKVKQ
ncbi:glutaminyl-peptide cyclotransferase [Carboxylicivirga linearis]|uniref:Glutaminyl-peptide cyclotransferase n=1 Tax=Carboxylicivirga linearis TaxID=1628157 RepID=A0ABS5JRK4_9BACT|nr:glutaminyl-peptide cyclotransferase [Carboxylicivirga linearis]MBS2097472.1 glutaminyl-peptide cyclotransferase [Carboxylicivirga linearis]